MVWIILAGFFFVLFFLLVVLLMISEEYFLSLTGNPFSFSLWRAKEIENVKEKMYWLRILSVVCLEVAVILFFYQVFFV